MWNRATIAVGLALYGWSMMLVELYLRGAGASSDPLQRFRRLTMGWAVIGLGAAAILAALILAFLGRRQRRAAALALGLGVAWLVCLAAIWPI